MVVEMDPTTDTHVDAQSRTYLKYQPSVPERSCPILNYVHHSANVLRKVRLGQPLDAALHCKPLVGSRRQRDRELSQPARIENMQLAKTLSTPPSSGVNFRRDRVQRRLQSLQAPEARQSEVSGSLSGLRDAHYQRNVLSSTVIPTIADGSRHRGHTWQHFAMTKDIDMNSDGTSRSSDSSPDQHNAALIIARFFRSACRLDNAADRAREVLRRRWREKHPEKYRSPLFELTHNEQLRVLQLYNPHLYGSQHPVSPLVSTSTSIRLSRVPHMEQWKRLRQLQVLERMGQETALLNDTCKQKTQTPASSTTTLREAYYRQPSASRERPKTVFDRKRAQQAHDLVIFPKSPPSFRFKLTAQSRLRLTRSFKSVSSLQPLSSPPDNN